MLGRRAMLKPTATMKVVDAAGSMLRHTRMVMGLLWKWFAAALLIGICAVGSTRRLEEMLMALM